MPLTEPAGAELLALCQGAITALLTAAGARVLGWYVTDATPNNLPRLPVREGEQVLLSLAMSGEAAAGHAWLQDLEPQLRPWLAKPAQTLRLAPTARSALHA